MRKMLITVLPVIIALIGIAVLLKSPALGMTAANSWLHDIGGSTGTEQFMVMVAGFVAAYRLLGAIMTVLGLIGGYLQLRESCR